MGRLFAKFLAPSMILDQFNGDGSTTAFTLSNSPAAAAGVGVIVNGVVMAPADYTLSGTTLTLSVAPVSGQGVQVAYLRAS